MKIIDMFENWALSEFKFLYKISKVEKVENFCIPPPKANIKFLLFLQGLENMG